MEDLKLKKTDYGCRWSGDPCGADGYSAFRLFTGFTIAAFTEW